MSYIIRANILFSSRLTRVQLRVAKTCVFISRPVRKKKKQKKKKASER